jgi:hypothetical protein
MGQDNKFSTTLRVSVSTYYESYHTGPTGACGSIACVNSVARRIP